MVNRPPRQIRSVAIITSLAFSLANFRGPLIAALVARGLRVYTLAPDFDAATLQAVRALGAEPVTIALERTGMNPFRDIVHGFKLIGQLRALSVDLVLCYFIKPVIYGGLAAFAARIRHRYALIAGLGYVFTPATGRETLRRRAIRLLAAGLYRIALPLYDRVFLQNADDVAYLVAHASLDRRKVAVLNGTGVDLAALPQSPTIAGPPIFLLMARLLREKGIVEFVDAARSLKSRYPEARFILLGGADPNPGGLAMSAVEGWVAEGAVEWPGHVDDVRPWLASASVFVLPSYREGKPRSTQEAMAIGRAIVTTDAPGCRDTVVEGVNGFLVPPRDAAALADAMERFIVDPSLIVTMGKASRALAEERYDVHKINAGMFKIMGIPDQPRPGPEI